MWKEIYAKRLLELAKFLRTDPGPRKRFDYTQWVGNDWKGDPSLSCGTTACALGWATTMPMFRRLGLELSRVTFGVKWRGKEGWERGAEKVFGLTRDEAVYLFTPNCWNWREDLYRGATAKQVARHIEKFVERKLREQKTASR